MLSIRSMVADDLALANRYLYQLNQLHHEAMPDYFKTPQQVAAAKDLTPYVTQAGCFGFIAEIDSKPVGFILGHVQELISPISKTLIMGSIDEMYVEPKYRGQQIGQRLLDRLEQQCRDYRASELFVETWAFNHQAQAFYQRAGLMPHVYWNRKTLAANPDAD